MVQVYVEAKQTHDMAITITPSLDNNDGTLRNVVKPYKHVATFLPTTTAQCHASNLLLRRNRDIWCAWFGGSQEGKPDISIYLSKLPAGSRTWTETVRMTHDSTRSEQNPVLFEAPNGEMRLMYTSQQAGNQDTAIVKQRISQDGGETWSEPSVLFSEAGTFIRQPMVVLDDGSYVMPIFKCRNEPGTRWVGHDDISAVQTSKDHGHTWQEVEVPNSVGAVHMQIRKLSDNSYLGLYRSRWADNIYESRSPDGINWTEPKPTSLPNPNSGICFDVLPNGRIVVIFNYSSRKDAIARREGLYDEIAEDGDTRANQGSKHADREAFWGSPRKMLSLGWSDDQGTTWKHKVIQEGDGYCMTNNSEQKLNRELSYPSIAVAEDGTIHVAFTFWRQGIKYVQIREDFFEV